MQSRTSVELEVDEPQPTVAVTLYHMAALAVELSAGRSEVVPDSWMKALTIGSLMYA